MLRSDINTTDIAENDVTTKSLGSSNAEQSSNKIQMQRVSGYFHYTLKQAAARMRKSESGLKDLCRKLGIKKWPNRLVSKIKSLVCTLKSLSLSSTVNNETREFYHENLIKLYRLLEIILENPVDNCVESDLDVIKSGIHDAVRNMSIKYPINIIEEDNGSSSTEKSHLLDNEDERHSIKRTIPLPEPTNPAVVRILTDVIEDVEVDDSPSGRKPKDLSRSYPNACKSDDKCELSSNFLRTIDVINSLGSTVNVNPRLRNSEAHLRGKGMEMFVGPVRLTPLKRTSQEILEFDDFLITNDQKTGSNENPKIRRRLILPSVDDGYDFDFAPKMLLSICGIASSNSKILNK